MNEQKQKRIEQLLKKSLPPLGDQVGAELRRDLWPAMLGRIDEDARRSAVPWFDWALLATVAAWLAFFPGAIPVLLYHL
jgi:hypothetical protein